MDIRKIKKIIEIVEKYGISELEIQKEKESIRINRASHASFYHNQMYQTSTSSSNQKFNISSKNNISNIDKKIDLKCYDDINNYVVKSPMVGTFYRTPHPDSKPFIEIGKNVNIGDVLCIVEAMKMMNQISAEIPGVVQAILVEDGQSVEFDQPIMIIKK
ncbi:acetyl-CoA carboxylase biotin carboxyl carrier protein [Candidatus Tachikawaea gelatinosa]|uniref:Biotin carboxyl carrier protein of acetyl-CoA carboxylase n=1 Tax=Candidatus Tachikawaea gelatinosa TaxID=1410383 RepID=A0A090AJR3_9ENTR|nr:acetyl-CoA carboxylase biotin carboxyl carrier protein [Candidatus Tachikawaea gelatinosa]BAP58693.1 acetyl-CoA carboxylase biotin carboxyl carrier [Candidatus Tachikawaea gelatinosa]